MVGDKIRFTLQRRRRKTLAITVKPDLSVWVAAPWRASRRLVEERVRRRSVWIRRQQAFFAEFHPPEPTRRFVSGETHRYLGRQYRLKLVKARKESVRLDRPFIRVCTRSPSNARRVRTLMQDWYRAHAHAIFRRNFLLCVRRFKTRLTVCPTLRLRRMPKRWGSCTRRGTIYLTPDLIRASSSCIDYVITHELCHVVHPQHDSRFFSLLRTVMPDWRDRKHRLEHLSLA